MYNLGANIVQLQKKDGMQTQRCLQQLKTDVCVCDVSSSLVCRRALVYRSLTQNDGFVRFISGKKTVQPVTCHSLSSAPVHTIILVCYVGDVEQPTRFPGVS